MPVLRRALLLSLLIGLLYPLLPRLGEWPGVRADSPTDWPQLRHDPAHSGYSDDATFSNPPPGLLSLRWKVSLGERVESPAEPIVAGGRVYIGVMDGRFHAFDATTGRPLWTYTTGDAITSAAAYSEGRVIFGSTDGAVYALDAASGALRWRFQTGGPVWSSPSVVNGLVYIGSFDGRLYALNAATGVEAWRFDAGSKVISSPAVGNGRVYFGAENVTAYAVDAATGALVWSRPLHGVNMRGAIPVLHTPSNTVIFETMKPGQRAYRPEDDLAAFTSIPAPQLWNSYYQKYPERQHLYFLDATTGEDKWDPAHGRFIPLPMAYWNFLYPLVDPQGRAYIVASGGGGNGHLDNDQRLWRVNLFDGTVEQLAAQDEFMHIFTEAGQHTLVGNQYYQTFDADLGVFDTVNKTRRALFGRPYDGSAFSTHADPMDLPPSVHLSRYGCIWMGGCTMAAGPFVVANGLGYYTSYGWLYAVGPETTAAPGTWSVSDAPGPPGSSQGPARRPPPKAPASFDPWTELANQVAQMIAAGHLAPEAKLYGWAPESEYAFWFEGETVAALAQALPYLAPDLRARTEAYLRQEMRDSILLNPEEYAYERRCLRWGASGVIRHCELEPGAIQAAWLMNNPNLVAERLYATWAYAEYSGDWDFVRRNWPVVRNRFNDLAQYWDASLGFYNFPEWLAGWFSLNNQMNAALAISRMAARVGDAATQADADARLNAMKAARLRHARYIQTQYDQGAIQPAPRPVTPDGHVEPYGYFAMAVEALIPCEERLDRDTDVRQVIYEAPGRIDVGGTYYRQYSDLIGYRPLDPEIGAWLRANLLAETQRYVAAIECNNPWWRWSDFAPETVGRAEERYTSPFLSFSMFQTKAYVLNEPYSTLVDQLPWTYAETGFRDRYRLLNLIALLRSPGAPASPGAPPSSPAPVGPTTAASATSATGAPATSRPASTATPAIPPTRILAPSSLPFYLPIFFKDPP